MVLSPSILPDYTDVASLPGSPVMSGPMDHKQTILSLVELLLKQHDSETGGGSVFLVYHDIC